MGGGPSCAPGIPTAAGKAPGAWQGRGGAGRGAYLAGAKMGSIKDRNGMDLTEAEDIKKRWQGYTKELYRKDLNDPDNHDGVITHLQPDTLEGKVKWV